MAKRLASLKNSELFQAMKLSFPQTVPVLTGFLAIGITYGVLMQSKGYGVIWSVAMSAIAFCGSMQFVAITLLTAVFDPIQAFLLSLTVNARHLFYSVSMLKQYSGMGKAKFFLVYTLCDETFSLLSGSEPPPGVTHKNYYIAVSLLDYIYWVLGTFLGGVLGSIVSISTNGIDFILTALFVVLFMEQIKRKENRLPGFLGLAAALVCLLIFGPGNFTIPSLILIVCLLFMGRKPLCSKL